MTGSRRGHLESAGTGVGSGNGLIGWPNIEGTEQAGWPRRYGAAIGLALVAAVVCALAQPWLGVTILPSLLAAVAVAAWVGGPGPGVAACMIAVAAAGTIQFGAPDGWNVAESLPGLAVFLVCALLICGLTASQRRTAMAARGSEASLRAMLDTANEGIWLVGLDGHVIFANGRIADLFGVEAASIVGRTADAFAAPDDAARHQDRFARAVAGQRDSFDGRFRRADGSTITLAGGTSPVRDAAGQVVAVLGMFTDVSEREHAEHELMNANERYALAADAMQELVYDRDLTSGATAFGPGLLHVTGWNPDEADPADRWWRDRIHPDDLPRHDRTIATMPIDEDRFREVYRVRHRDDRYRVVRDIGRVVRDGSGRPVRAVGSVVDITEQDAAETALRILARAAELLAGETDYERTLAVVAGLAVPEIADWCAVDLLDGTGNVIRAAVTPGAATVHAAAIWRPDAEWVRSGARVVIHEIAGAVGILGAEQAAALASAGVVSLLSAPLETRGERLGALTMLSLRPDRRFRERDLDLAEHLARRSALAIENARLYSDAQAAQARFRGIFEGTTDGLIVLNAQGAIVDVNPAVSALLNSSPDRLLGRALADLAAAWSAADMAELRVNGGWRGELDLLVSGGDPAPVDVSIARVDLDGNEVYVAVMRDVRERREYERTQEEFLASVAHDLKNPLAAVRGQAQLLRRRMLRGEMPDPERLLAGLTAIDAGAGRMAGMIDELVDVARLRAGQPIELRRQPVDLAALAQRHVEEMQRLDDRHQFILEAGDAPVFGMWDSARIERVVANLVGNAIKFSPRGGPVTIRVGRGEAFGGPCAVLSVSDQGVGIPASDLPYVFERFHRGRNVGSIRGSGIGLAGARSIVEGHGGTIAVESAEGTGSTFTVRLPLDAP